MRNNWTGLVIGLTIFAGAAAEVSRPTVAGTLESANGSQVVIRTETGKMWRAELQPGSRCEWMGSNRNLSAIPKGSKVMLRVVGSLGDNPLKVDLLSDWMSSSKYVATTAPAPYFTRMGEWAGPGGVGGRPPGAPEVGKGKNVGGYAVNGGMPHQNQPEVPDIMAAKAQDPGVAKVGVGTPGFQMGPTPGPAVSPPAGQTSNANSTPTQDATMISPSYPSNGVNPVTGQPYTGANAYNPGMQPGMYPGMQPGMQPGMYPGMQPGMQPGMYPGMQPGMQPGMDPAMSSSRGLDSLLNTGDPENQDTGGPMFPGMGMQMGMPVSMQATVMRCDPATHSLVVQAIGTQIPQTVIVGPQYSIPPLREGQAVMINGTSNPQGYIEAQQITPLGQ